MQGGLALFQRLHWAYPTPEGRALLRAFSEPYLSIPGETPRALL
jgi:hypothetical protein